MVTCPPDRVPLVGKEVREAAWEAETTSIQAHQTTMDRALGMLVPGTTGVGFSVTVMVMVMMMTLVTVFRDR